jgi:tRNA A-37 threonylcarbamoyl transferase component Bud32
VSDARRELLFSRYLRGRGVPTSRPLAVACIGGKEWLATEAVGDAEPADAWHERQLEAGLAGQAAIRRATVELARLVGHMHAAGVIHRDLHCGNVLVRPGPPGADAPELVLMDLHRVYRRRRLSRRARSANLAQLFHDRLHVTTRTDRLRFLKHYRAAAGAEGSLRGWQLTVEHLAAIHRGRQHRQRDARVFEDGKYFARLRLEDGWRGHAVLASKRHMAGSEAAGRSFTVDQWARLLRRPDDLFGGAGVEVVKDSPSGLLVRRRIELGGRGVSVYIKRTRRKHTWKAVFDCFRLARPLRAFALGHALLTRRIATALPLAAIERRVGPFLADSILITEEVAAPRLNQFLNTWLATPPRGDVPLTGPQQQHLAQCVLAQLGRLLQRLHDGRYFHRDLKASNLLVRWQVGRVPELVLIDLDGLHRCRLLTARRRFQGIMRLNVSLLKCPVVNRAGRLRMLLGYLRRPGGGSIAYKPYWRMLDEWSAHKLDQQIRSRRKRQRVQRGPAP